MATNIKPLLVFGAAMIVTSCAQVSSVKETATEAATSAVRTDTVASVTLPEEQKAFNPMFGPVEFADAFGSRDTGPHGTFGKFPAGFETPGHTHTHGYSAVVLKGEMTNPFAGEENPPVMAVGSFWAVAAGEDHTTACVSDTPCEFLMWGDRNFDFVANQ